MSTMRVKTASAGTPEQPTFDVKDSRGRTITIGKPNFSDEMDFLNVLEDKDTEVFRRTHTWYLWVRAIDGVAQPCIGSRAMLLGLRDRLGEEGYVALCQGIEKHFMGEEASKKSEDFAKK